MSERMDRPLATAVRARLWLHLQACHSCRRVGDQMALMRNALRRLGQ